MPKRKQIDTSLAAYHSLKAEDVRNIYKKILEALKVLGSANTEVISDYLTLPHPKVHKRTSEMERLEMIYKPGTKSVMKSGRMGFNWSIRGTGQKESAVETNYKKETKTAATIASDIINNSGNLKQQKLFNI